MGDARRALKKNDRVRTTEGEGTYLRRASNGLLEIQLDGSKYIDIMREDEVELLGDEDENT